MRVNIENTYAYCPYCRNKMKIAKVRVKRPAPLGAKDLNLFDEIVCWRCPQCQHTTADRISKCPCGSYILEWHGIPASDAYEKDAPRFQARLTYIIDSRSGESQFTYGRCTACEKCAECGQSLNSFEVESDTSYTEYDEERDRWVYFQYVHYHKLCFAKHQGYSAEEKRQREENERRSEEVDIKRRLEEAMRYFREHGS
ncbi:MAG TPA: hypothetical protein VF546_21655 [Pyrinomonadaceae bacterium]